MTVTCSNIFIPRGSAAVNRHPVTIWWSISYETLLGCNADADADADEDADEDADLPEDVDNGYIEVTGQEEILSRGR